MFVVITLGVSFRFLAWSLSHQADVLSSSGSLQQLLEESRQVIMGTSEHSGSAPPSVLLNNPSTADHPRKHHACHCCHTGTTQRVGMGSASGLFWVSLFRGAVTTEVLGLCFGCALTERVLLSFLFQQDGGTPPTAVPPPQDTWTTSP